MARQDEYHDARLATILEFSPSLVGLMISGGNHSFDMIKSSGECVINLPTTALTDTVVGIGNTSGAEINKFAEFGLTAGPRCRGAADR
jgi:flavin reductase (DIM6/NTAB) family NADH-FMN oxidoreductase RutF